MFAKVAVPSVSPGGLNAMIMPHFGHCDIFTVVELEDFSVKKVSILPNMPHGDGGCTAPVQYLADNGITIMLAGGMGMRPLQAFLERGIMVLFAGYDVTVEQAVQGYTEGRLQAFGDNGLCRGGCGH